MKCVGKIKWGIFGILCFMIMGLNVNAASVGLKASSSSITKGGTVTITATVSSSSPLVTIEGNLSCSGAGVNGGTALSFEDSSNGVYSKSFSYTAKASSTGTITCSTSGVRILDMSSSSWINLNNASASVSVKDAVVIPPKEYSSNNNLSELSIEGFDLDPKFDKDTLEYNVEVPNDTDKVIINAKKEDSTASVSGAGEVSVSEGTNKISIKVTAQNGNERVYVINVNVKELDPIEVKIDDKNYTVIRKDDVLEPPAGYEKTSVKIGDEDVLAYTNLKTKYTLVGLKDEDGNSNWYIFDEKTDSYILYVYYDFNGVSLIIEDMPESLIPHDFVKSSFEYNDERVVGYKYKSSSQFYLIYGMNSETGEKDLYMFDKKEGTVQRFNDEIADIYKDKADLYFMILMIISGIVGLAIVTTAIVLIIKTGKRKKNKIKF